MDNRIEPVITRLTEEGSIEIDNNCIKKWSIIFLAPVSLYEIQEEIYKRVHRLMNEVYPVVTDYESFKMVPFKFTGVKLKVKIDDTNVIRFDEKYKDSTTFNMYIDFTQFKEV